MSIFSKAVNKTVSNVKSVGSRISNVPVVGNIFKATGATGLKNAMQAYQSNFQTLLSYRTGDIGSALSGALGRPIGLGAAEVAGSGSGGGSTTIPEFAKNTSGGFNFKIILWIVGGALGIFLLFKLARH